MLTTTDLSALNLSDEKATELAELLGQCDTCDPESIDETLRQASVIMGGHGVESLEDPDRPGREPAALYVNVGDPYRPTLLYDRGHELWDVAGYGDWLEAFESDRETDGGAHCGSCGDDLDTNCHGRPRCPTCDGPCPCCDDGGGPGEPQGPAEDDLITEDHRRFYCHGRLAFEVPADASYDEMWDAIDGWMTRQQYWPNVWAISDHGNAHLMSRD